MSSKVVISGIVIFSLVFIVGSYLLLNTSGKPQSKVLSYNSKDKEKPIADVKESFKDFGKIKVSEEKKATFTVKNIGTKPLQLSDVNSSCGCTVGQIVYKGSESKEFGMHTPGTEVFEIAPQTEAQVRVTYRPFVMPVNGFVEREVYINTNDPDNSKLIFKVKAFVN